MIEIQNLDQSEPYTVFKSFYKIAFNKTPLGLERILIASFDKTSNQVEARYVNLKYIFGNEWVFFTNYNSPKAKQFNEHSQISAVFYWECINVQIKIKAKIFKTDKDFSDKHFSKRSKFKNAVSITSNQSKTIKSYEALKEKYDHYIENNTCMNRPDYWGGFSFTPYYFEFWEGHESRLNKREVYEKSDDSWKHLILQP